MSKRRADMFIVRRRQSGVSHLSSFPILYVLRIEGAEVCLHCEDTLSSMKDRLYLYL